ncbi:MAG: thymidylate synthase complementing protein ThyX family protein [Chloroflexi bacterium OLB14]|nr:MAG: thymidylate synthase complementing protein ThyX family protein [Chloroflexi bacterium OLB14]
MTYYKEKPCLNEKFIYYHHAHSALKQSRLHLQKHHVRLNHFVKLQMNSVTKKSAQFHEKWVVGYGHASVAEHAVLHIAFENVSRIAIEAIEGNRLASYTEKSTRYQKWGQDDFTIPPELDNHPLLDEFTKTVRLLFSTYADSLQPVKNLVVQRVTRKENESDEAFDRRIRSQYVDRCRFYFASRRQCKCRYDRQRACNRKYDSQNAFTSTSRSEADW